MSKRKAFVVAAALAVGLAVALPGAAHAQPWQSGGGAPSVALGAAIGYDAVYKTYPPSHYRPPRCAWVTERYRRNGRWHWHRVWRCR